MFDIRSCLCTILLCLLSTQVIGQNDPDAEVKLSRANAFFADKLYKELSKNSANLIFSPLSISVALSMVGVGASGKTFQEINNTLGFPYAHLNEQELLLGYQNMVTAMTSAVNGYQFSLANALFLQNSFPIYPNYTSIIVQDFHAESRLVDFSNQEETLAVINGFVSNVTHGKITSILDQVTPLDVMALVNAVYFKGSWENAFDERSTFDADFFTEDGTRKPMKLMTKDVSVNYNPNHHSGASVLELPYASNTFSMIFLLPQRGANLSNLEIALTPEVLLNLTRDLHPTNVSIGVPKVKFESEFDLINHLRALGINDVFDDSADLTRTSSAFLKVSQAKHKATIDINEEGSEAAAATAIVYMTRTGGNHKPYFWLNRPFMFVIRHNPTNTVCFMGRLADV